MTKESERSQQEITQDEINQEQNNVTSGQGSSTDCLDSRLMDTPLEQGDDQCSRVDNVSLVSMTKAVTDDKLDNMINSETKDSQVSPQPSDGSSGDEHLKSDSPVVVNTGNTSMESKLCLASKSRRLNVKRSSSVVSPCAVASQFALASTTCDPRYLDV